MRIVKVVVLLFVLTLSCQLSVMAQQNKVVVVPMEDGSLLPIVTKPELPSNPIYLQDAIDKPMVWNQGWDTNIGHKTKIDPTVVIKFQGIRPTPYGSSNSIYYNAPEIKHWGLQRTFNSDKPIYAKGALFIDKGQTVEGGVFEWSLNRQGFMSLYNIFTKKSKYPPWMQRWTPPRSGDKVWFVLVSDDERFSSNPFTFIWP